MNCNKQHRYDEKFKDLPYSQDNQHNARHRCTGCAYEEGIKDAINKKPMAKVLSSHIPESQAGAGRHKDAYEAYILGYKDGLKNKARNSDTI